MSGGNPRAIGFVDECLACRVGQEVGKDLDAAETDRCAAAGPDAGSAGGPATGHPHRGRPGGQRRRFRHAFRAGRDLRRPGPGADLRPRGHPPRGVRIFRRRPDRTRPPGCRARPRRERKPPSRHGARIARRHHLGAPRKRGAPGPAEGRGGERGEIAPARDGQPRVPHAAQRHPRPDRAPARDAAHARPGDLCRAASNPRARRCSRWSTTCSTSPRSRPAASIFARADRSRGAAPGHRRAARRARPRQGHRHRRRGSGRDVAAQ